MKRYNPKEIEPKWQQSWVDNGIYTASNNSDKPKKFILEFFPYPSGAAMHVGHVRNYTIGDATARYWRMNGHNVLHPMGWDAFGLPAENYAIKTGISPQQAVANNVGNFKQQLQQMGFGYDWSREINSTDPNYYKWTQWFFTLLFKRGLAYQSENMQWWCDKCKTVLANEQVVNGKCWRHDDASDPLVEKRPVRQWFFKITDYADRLIADLEDLDWSESIKSMQRNWIGKSQGAEIDFKVSGHETTLKVFTTRPDTLFGATFLVLAPEHDLVDSITSPEQSAVVAEYKEASTQKNEIERMEENRPKTGVFTGAYAINPINGESIPVWIADYVLTGYGTGAIMAVPAHDKRDWDFAAEYNLPVIRVVDNQEADDACTHEEGIMTRSGAYDGMTSQEARERIVAFLAAGGDAVEKTNYRIRDWLISRQRYWGAPIPIVWVDSGVTSFSGEVKEALADYVEIKQVGGQKLRAVPVPQAQLPVLLPEVESYEPDGSGRSPLARVEDWLHVWFNTDSGQTVAYSSGQPQDGSWVEGWRETDTQDGFACSSWYFLRFADPDNQDAPFSRAAADYWLPVDTYIGGAEHAVMHLLYARMWTKVMYDAGLIDFIEPFMALKNQGMILAPDGQKMSKSKGNTIAPAELLDQGYGADAVRVMELFVGPWNQQANWSVSGMGGCYRFLNRVWNITQAYIEAQTTNSPESETVDGSQEILRATHTAIKRVTTDMRDFGFNTALAAMMEFVNQLYKLQDSAPINRAANAAAWKFAIQSLLQLLAPIAPHITEELWAQLQGEGVDSIHTSNWPQWDEHLLVSNTMTIAVQVNGKVRGTIEVPTDLAEDAIIAQAIEQSHVANHLAGAQPVKTIYIPGKIVSLVVKS